MFAGKVWVWLSCHEALLLLLHFPYHPCFAPLPGVWLWSDRSGASAFLLWFIQNSVSFGNFALLNIWSFTFDFRNHWYNMVNDKGQGRPHTMCHESFCLNIIRGGLKFSEHSISFFFYALSEKRWSCCWLLRAVDCKAAVSLGPWPAPLPLAHYRNTQRSDGAGVGRRQELLLMSTEGDTLTLASPVPTPYVCQM